jgi:hypothetical protein
MRLKSLLLTIPLLANATVFSFDLTTYDQFLEKNNTLSTGTMVDNAKPSLPYYSEISLEKSNLFLDSIQKKYGLTSTELDMLKKNNFVVTERKSFETFGHGLRDIFNKDLPVFLTTDAVLYTLHLSYDKILSEIEKASFEPVIKDVISKMRKSFPDLSSKYASSGINENLSDVDLYLAIAESMISGTKSLPSVASVTEFEKVYKAVTSEKMVEMPLFSEGVRLLDFSQFTVRGHYVSANLQNYFKTMMWLGRTELLITSPKQGDAELISKKDTKRMTIDAILLSELLSLSGGKNSLDEMDKLLSYFVGDSDNLTIDEFLSSLETCSISSAEKVLSDSVYKSLADKLSSTPEAGQKILSQVIMTCSSGTDTLELPVSFLFFGQRFIVDSYVFGNVIYDKILHNGTKMTRMMPDPLDAVYALGNNDAAPLLKNELEKYFYAPQLEKMRYLLDSYELSFWRGTAYNSWLNIIRKLNPGAYPQVEMQPLFMRSAAWHQEKLNTQLASWAQLRHDNLLYAKQSYTPGISCSYPHGYVEPYPTFYEEFAHYARTAAEKLKSVQAIPYLNSYYTRVAGLMDTLKTLAEKELAKQPFTVSDSAFMARMLVVDNMCGTPITSGWYANLIYDNSSVEKGDYTIADVHTQPTDESGAMVGRVLHVGVGKINLGVFLAESPSAGYKPMAYAGPVISYYQKVTGDFKRLTDEEWASMVAKDSIPARPDWVNCFLANNSGAKLPEGRLLDGIKYSTNVIHKNGNARLLSFVAKANGNAITLTLPSAANVQIALYDLHGKSLGNINKSLSTGIHTITFPSASGLYTAVVKCNGKTLTLPVNKIMK